MAVPGNDAFQDLCRIFSARKERILEIEILPPALGPLLQDGCSIGITKKHIVKAFMVARHIFFQALDADDPASAPLRKDTDTELAVCSEIILLYDCEHLTACNWRKRRILALVPSHDHDDLDPAQRQTIIQALDTELSLMKTYLCSPLPRHTKSPTLWQHRLWVLDYKMRVQSGGGSDAFSLLNAELSTVLRAGELHPKNYYAFNYMRLFHSRLSQSTEDGPAVLAQSILEPTLTWCLLHPADISGWGFVLYQLEAVPDQTIREDTVEKALRYAIGIRWEGESLYTFVDLAVRAFAAMDRASKVLGMSPTDADTFGSRLNHGPARWKAWRDAAKEVWTAKRRGGGMVDDPA
ncbi:hypothetical protein BDW42DRAFT_182169 [Aspergillus taichungensis]|uniref:Protein prenylyltransferase n=1 Tax=Aspergillus taichungensis TaxID=482145 RepID=A0A2J5HCK6_9EURO|nr:hypothetical protein BDW42DRAFT_182169 [Aspergillus taichungensis]